MSKHTPGPWKVSRLDGRTIGFTDDRIEPGYQSNFHAICYVRERIGQTEANIALIAAAPELLEALKQVTPPLPSKDAICHNGLVAQEQCFHCQRILRAHAAIAKAEDQ